MSRALSRRDVAALGVLVVLAVGHALWFGHIADDAYISFRFAANWAEGHGLVFNPGEYVMGYSNFLWVMLLGIAEWLGVQAPTAASVLGIVCGWATLVLVYWYVRSAFGSSLAATGAGLLLVTNGTFALWLVGGLEGPLFGLLLTAGTILALRLEHSSRSVGFVGLGVLLGLAALTRPEGVFYGPVIGGMLWLRCPDVKRARDVGIALATCLAIFALFTAWVWAYYGDPLPNPTYAKLHALSGPLLLRGAGIASWFVVGYAGMPIVVVVTWATLCRNRWTSPGWLPLAVLAAFVVFFLRVGGDGQAFYRMWFWVLPMLALLLGEALATSQYSHHPWARVWAISVIAAVSISNLQHSFFGEEIERVRQDEVLTRDVIAIARDLARRHPGALVAANNVGALAYVSRLAVIDMLGLTDRHIARARGKALGFPAHESHDAGYVLDRHPDIIFYGQPRAFSKPLRREDVLEVSYPSDLDLRSRPRFLHEYAFEHLRLRDGRFVPLFRRVEAKSP
jgi:hypothetical protein